MNIPDYVSPIVAYRAWTWGQSGLVSLNGESWVAGKPLLATCNIWSRRSPFVRMRSTFRHESPQIECTCGIYAAKDLEQLHRIGYGGLGIYGEVYLWGTVVEHRLGWRAQFAYPKTLVLSPASLLLRKRALTSHFGRVSCERFPSLFQKNDVKSCLAALTPYGTDIFVVDGTENPVPIWTKRSGYDAAGLDRWNEAASEMTRFLPRVAVLTEDRERGKRLEKRVEDTNIAQVVFQQVCLPVHATDAIICQIQDQRPKVVIVDLEPRNPWPGIRAIELIRGALGHIALVAVGDIRNLDNVTGAIAAGADEYVDRDNKRNFAEALERVLLGSPARSRRKRAYRGGSPPPGGSTPPGGPPPPPAVLVLSPRNWPRLPSGNTVAWAI